MASPNRFLQAKTTRFPILITIIIAALFLGTAAAYAQAGAFVGIETITCDATGYNITIAPEPNWTQSWCSAQGFDYLGPPVDWCYDIGSSIMVYQVPPEIRYAPASDPLSETWSNLGKDSATIYYNIHWMYSDVAPVSWTHVYYPSGPVPGSSTVAVTVNKADCLAPQGPSSPACELIPRYYMYTLQDVNQQSIWAKDCYIISSNGYPSVEIQAKLCTPPGSEHTFRATNIPFGGWVSTDCQGNAFYGWPGWDANWYRSGYAK